MKYAAVAVTLVGAAIAESTLDIQWEAYTSTTTTTAKWVDPTASSSWTAWEDPAKETSTTASWTAWEDPSKETSTTSSKETWATWSSSTTTSAKCSYVTEVPVTRCAPYDSSKCRVDKTKTTYYADTCTWADWVDPAKSTTAWEDWNTWAATTTTTTSAKCSYVTEYSTSKCAPHDSSKCWPAKATSTVYPDNCDDWSEWNSWTSPAPTATCSYTKEFVYKKCKPDTTTLCISKTKTETIYPTDCTEWAEWEKTKTVEASVTWADWQPEPTDVEGYTWASWAKPSTVEVTTASGYSKDGWFGPAWPSMAAGGCATNVLTSYGYPMWKPTPEPTTTWAPAPSMPAKPAAPAAPADKGHAMYAPNGNKWSMTYSPYDNKGHCKTEEVIKVDIKKIADMGFTSVRVYSTDCKTLEFVGAACKEHKLTIILGVFISKTGIEGAKEQVAMIKKWAQWEMVELIVIGNEAVFQGFCSAEELVSFISYCKGEFKGAGYTGSCTTTEPLNIWQEKGSQFCEVVDVVSANLYAYFNTECSADNAGTFIQSQIEILTKICVSKETYVMESGWPSAGECNGAACPGKDEQAKAIKGISSLVGAKVVFFSFEDEQWKEPGQFGVEQHWGCSDVFAADSWSNVPVTKTTTAAWATYTTPFDPTSTWATWTTTSSDPAKVTAWEKY